jgi:hypothetical protein
MIRVCCLLVLNLREHLRVANILILTATNCMSELKFLQEFISNKDMGPHDILKFVKQMGCFSNAHIAYRILLTIPVTLASKLFEIEVA